MCIVTPVTSTPAPPPSPTSSPRTTRRRPRRTLVVAGLATAGLVGAAALADQLVGRQLAHTAAENLSCRLGIDNARVAIDGWPRSMPLITHALPSVDLRAQNVDVEGVSAALDLTLRNVRDESDGALETDGGTGTVSVPLTTVLADLGKGLPDDLTVRGEGERIVALMAGGAAELALVPRVSEGRLALRPDGLQVGGKEIEGELAEQLIDQALSQGGSKAAGRVLTEGVEMPLPEGVSLRDVAVSQAALLLEVDVAAGDASDLLGSGETCA